MKKFYLLLFLPFVAITSTNAQTVVSGTFNVRELAAYEAAHPELFEAQCRTCPQREIDGGWKGLAEMPASTRNVTTLPALLRPYVPNTPTSPLANSPAPIQDFLGHVDVASTIPPDTHGAVGINQVVTATNNFFRVQNKVGGAVLSNVTISSFTGIPTSCDPYVKFDPYTNRWWFSAIGCAGGANNSIFLAVSATSDATGTWRKYSWVTSSTDGAILLDHPYLGFDNRLVVVSGRKFLNGASFTGPILFAFDKANLLAGGNITFGTNAQSLEKANADGDSPLPVTVYGLTSPSTDFNILQQWNGPAGQIRLSKITGNIPSLVWNTAGAFFPTAPSSYNGLTLGNIAQQLTETRRLATNDGRISTGVMVNGSIWCAQHVGLPATGTATSTAVQWWQINPVNGAVQQTGRIGGAPGTWRYYPGIAVNANNDVIIGYTVSTTTTRVGAAYSTRSVSTPNNTMDAEFLYKAGIDTYWKDFNSGRARWGDYSHSALDPVDGSLWTIQQYADARTGTTDAGSRWGVWWAQVVMPSALLNRDASLAGIVAPAAGSRSCVLPISPRVTIRNIGTDTLKTVNVTMQLDANAPTAPEAFTLTAPGLPTFAGQDVTLSTTINPGPGQHTLKIWTSLPNGGSDLRTSNDTTTITFFVQESIATPFTEGFESTTFPPANGWGLLNFDGGTTWTRSTLAAKTGVASMRINSFSYNTRGALDILRTPKIQLAGIDSIKVNFQVAYARFSAGFNDSLMIVYSEDCGVTWKRTSFVKGGAALTTNGGAFVTTNFTPTASQWRAESLVLSTCNITADNIMIGIQSRNDFGNNMYVDDFSVTSVASFTHNAGTVAINEPPATLCTNTFTPRVTISNTGAGPLTSVAINYRVDGGAINTFNWTGNLPRCSTTVVTLNPVTSVPGNHVLTVYTTNPNGNADQYTLNDTAAKPFNISPVLATPVVEGFETTTFPPTNWSVQNPDGLITWARSTAGARTGAGAMLMNNFTYAPNTVDRFFSPLVQNSAALDSVFVSFDYAYMQGAQYPGATVRPLDTLELMITQDCGASFKTIWKKWGEDLQTVNDPNNSNALGFTPRSVSEWKNARIYLSPTVGTGNFQVYFVAKGNRQNNIWIDNINISSKVLPKRLKDQGYLVYPSPFNNTFRIHHWQVPTDLQAVQIFNAAGQLVWDKRYAGSANTEIFVDLSRLANGVYVLKMMYNNKTVVERLVKE
jgi:Secretion system C-terminal sorting domain